MGLCFLITDIFVCKMTMFCIKINWEYSTNQRILLYVKSVKSIQFSLLIIKIDVHLILVSQMSLKNQRGIRRCYNTSHGQSSNSSKDACMYICSVTSVVSDSL